MRYSFEFTEDQIDDLAIILPEEIIIFYTRYFNNRRSRWVYKIKYMKPLTFTRNTGSWGGEMKKL